MVICGGVCGGVDVCVCCVCDDVRCGVIDVC